MRLNVGPGEHYAPGWVNVDRNAMPHWPHPPDVRASVYSLPWPAGTFDRAYLGHVLEHIPWQDVPTVVGEVMRVCRPGAPIVIVGPCIERAIATDQPSWLLRQICRTSDLDAAGVGHAWTATGRMTADLLRETGLDDVTEVDVAGIVPPDWPNDCQAPWQFAITATCPGEAA